MIKIQIEDTIVDVLKKIWEEKENKVLLDFPFWHSILHNHLSLRIIQTKTRNKTLVIISNDMTAKKIGKLLWIRFIKNKNSDCSEIKSNRENIKENYSFLEYAKFEIKSFFTKFIWNIKSNQKINSIYYIKNKYDSTNKNITPYFILTLVIILSVLIYIYYFAINKTSITIYPEIDVNVKSRNFNFIEKDINNQKYVLNNQVELNRITKIIHLEKQISTSWLDQDNNNKATWKALFSNLLEEEAYLLKNTTLETKEWVQFYIDKDIIIPASTKSEYWKDIPWEKVIQIYWKIKLLNWEYSWVKTNIWTWSLLTIPKLDKLNRSKIYARSITKFNWGSNKFIKVLKKEDIENAKKIMTDDLKTAWIKKIKEEIDILNKNNSIKIELLAVDNIFKFTDLEINIPEHIKPWDIIDNFTISWDIKVYTFTYNKEVVISLLKNIIDESIITDIQKIVSIDEDSLRMPHIIKRNDLEKVNGRYRYSKKFNKKLRLKATVEIEYNVSKKFNNKEDFLWQKIRDSISWKNIEKAEKILINRREINNVEISVQPFFINTISQIPENIKIYVED